MQASIYIKCKGCFRWLDHLDIDTADMPDELQSKINKVILAHRHDCTYYNSEKAEIEGGSLPSEDSDRAVLKQKVTELDTLIRFWKGSLAEHRLLMSPEAVYLIEQTIKSLQDLAEREKGPSGAT